MIKHYVKDVLAVLYEKFEDVFDTIYLGHRPSAVSPQQREFLVISTGSSIYSHGPFQNASIHFEIFVKNRQGGIEATDRLQEYLDEIDARIPFDYYEKEGDANPRFKIVNPQLAIRGDDNLGFTIWVVRARLLVNTTDRYKALPEEEESETETDDVTDEEEFESGETETDNN